MTSGFVLIHRSLFGNPHFRGRDDEYAAVWLIAHAAWEPTTIRVNRVPVRLDRGQCAYAVSYLAQAWECSKATAHARLRFLERTGFIQTQAERDYTVITICKYSEYQLSPNADRTQGKTPAEREPNADRTNKNEGNQGNKSNEGNGEHRSQSVPRAAEPAPRADVTDQEHLDALFDEWWAQYPRYRRGSKGPTRKKWLSVVRRKQATPSDLMAGLMRYNAAGYAVSQFACGAERWLNDERWTIESFPIPGDVESAAQQAHGDTHGAFRHDRSHRPVSRNGFCAIIAERAGARELEDNLPFPVDGEDNG